jgi:nucleotide-binding universal stress UspA family protein
MTIVQRLASRTSSQFPQSLHVDSWIMRQGNEIYERECFDFQQKGIKLLRSFTEKAIATGVSTEFSQITGHPSSTICEFAHCCHADIIVMGKRGHLGLKQMFTGSISNYVLHHSPCSILLVPTPALEDSTLPKGVEHQIYA